MTENQLHDLIINDNNTINGLNNILIDSSYGEYQYIHEDRYINGIIADFTLIVDNKIKSIIECKGDNIGVTDYVRGIGQIFQYEYFYEENISIKGYEYYNEFHSVLIVPSSVFKDRSFNIGKFKYPKSLKLLEINDTNKIIREISREELNKLKQSIDKDLITVSQYYFRDNRVFEYYILLKYLSFLHFKGENNINRKKIEENFLKKIGTPNNNNWRNAFITLSSLGLINSNNIPTPYGFNLSHLKYEEFSAKILQSYMTQYIDEIYSIFKNNIISISNQEIRSKIISKYSNKDILFLTESNGRYISSWLNILRDDYGCIDFLPKNKERTILYNPNELTFNALVKKIKENSKAYTYIEKFNLLLRSE